MNETIRNILERRSIRGYEKTPVPQELLELLVECGQYAATGMGLQAWHFTVLTNRALMDKCTEANRAVMLADPSEFARNMAKAPDFDAWRGAPAAIIVSSEDGKDLSIADCANAMQNMAVAAHSLGLGSCYMAAFKVGMLAPGNEYLLKELGIPEGFTPQFALAVGYGNKEPDPRVPRREGAVNYVK